LLSFSSEVILESHVRFNPTAYIEEKNTKIRQNQLEKYFLNRIKIRNSMIFLRKKPTRRILSPDQYHSDSDISSLSLAISKDATCKSVENNRHSAKSRFVWKFVFLFETICLSSSRKRTHSHNQPKSADAIDSVNSSNDKY
jgi:hypothetical protein